jgi:hypothetical protein
MCQQCPNELSGIPPYLLPSKLARKLGMPWATAALVRCTFLAPKIDSSFLPAPFHTISISCSDVHRVSPSGSRDSSMHMSSTHAPAHPSLQACDGRKEADQDAVIPLLKVWCLSDCVFILELRRAATQFAPLK